MWDVQQLWVLRILGVCKIVWSVSYRIVCSYIQWGWITETSIRVTIATTCHISIYQNMRFPFEDLHRGLCDDGGTILKCFDIV